MTRIRSTLRNRAGAVHLARILLPAWTALVPAATITPSQPPGTSGYNVFWVPGQGLWDDWDGGVSATERAMILRLQLADAAMFIPLGTLLTFTRPTLTPARTTLAMSTGPSGRHRLADTGGRPHRAKMNP
ncbi:hypothetical protein IAG44_22590 [Streptomyces roseirectus]|uniref:Uncharacterized protein n=1 Tax=Streptomyces roseirectus TaxID=2768066 RepID=A0A7H0IGK9_9ACTN|nr:hypothetical protein [Streptomyces roseirectus]QNP71925.1 hypothetical protein IAG44_22590 [Streptomyces roseirectus]